MMTKLYKNIAAGLKAIKDCKIYIEEVPQNFTQPSFLILLYDQNPTRGINGRLKNTVQVDLLYFPGDENAANAACWEMGQNLTREFSMTDFKIKNRNLKITDRVLHFMFDVDYRECPEDTTPAMQTMSQNTDVKEE